MPASEAGSSTHYRTAGRAADCSSASADNASYAPVFRKVALNGSNLDDRPKSDYPTSIVINQPCTRLLSIVLLSGLSVVGRADTMMKTRTVITDSDEKSNVENPKVTRNVQYRQGNMRREDSLSAEARPSIEQIANCETKTGFLIDPNAHKYRNYNLPRFATEAQRDEYLQKTGKTAIQVESKTVDTGERRVFFGHSARHLITTTKRADENGQGGEEIVDGWYIDHELPDRNCAPDFVRSEPYYVIGAALVDYPDIAQFHHTGPLPTGLMVISKFTDKHAVTKDGKQGRTITIEKTVEELSDSPLSPSLFELPTGLHETPGLFRGHSTSSR